jgi:hypothetical protein
MNEHVLIYSYGSEIFLNLYDDDTSMEMNVYDMEGHCVWSAEGKGTPFCRISLPLATGFYIVSINLGGETYSEKVFLESI